MELCTDAHVILLEVAEFEQDVPTNQTKNSVQILGVLMLKNCTSTITNAKLYCHINSIFEEM